MSSLHLQQANALQQQKQADQENRPYPAPAHAGQAAIPAPMPTRTTPAAGPTNGMWTPDMPIRFGSGGPGPAGAAPPGNAKGAVQDARWDPSKGMKFA